MYDVYSNKSGRVVGQFFSKNDALDFASFSNATYPADPVSVALAGSLSARLQRLFQEA